MKRFRNTEGRILLSAGEIARQTQAEASAYYQNGGRYRMNWPGRQGKAKIFVCRRFWRQTPNGIAEIASFDAEDGSNSRFTTGADVLGIFLPDVANDGFEIVRVPDDFSHPA